MFKAFQFSVRLVSAMFALVSAYAERNPLSYTTLLNLCNNSEELRIFLLQSGLLGDRSGLCEYCNRGYVYLTKKEGTFYWKYGLNATLRRLTFRF